jgi:uncharacterized protein YkwD
MADAFAPSPHPLIRRPRVRTAARPPAAPSHLLERLEDRALLFAWSSQEVYFAELVNRARANPQAEAARLGLDLTAGLNGAEIARLVPSEPLALSPQLTQSARAHAADMAARNFFNIVNPDAKTPTQRAQARGYQGTAGENIGAGYDTLDDLYRAWMASPDQRRNLLSLVPQFDSTYHYDQLGPGFTTEARNAQYANYYAADFGNPSLSARTQWLVGVVFSDANFNAFYDPGEGLAGVRIDVFAGAPSGAPLASYTTDAAGNYQLALASGSYSAVYTLLSTGATVTKAFTVTGQNVKVDARAADFALPQSDDYPDAGDWSLAPALAVEPSTGNAVRSGSIETTGDSDLFRFVPARSGPTQVNVAGMGGLSARVRVYSASGTLLGTGSPAGQSSLLTVDLLAGQAYFALVDGLSGSGNYTLYVQGAPDNPPPPAPPPSDLLVAGGPVNPLTITVSGAPREVVAYVAQSGQPVFAERDAAGAWVRTDLQSATGSPAVTGELQVWQDRRDGYVYAAGTGPQGVVLFKRDPAGAWSFRNLTQEIKVSRPIVSNLTVFNDAEGLTQIGGLTAEGHVVTYWQTGLLWPGHNYRYFYTDITTRDLVMRSVPMPELRPGVTSYVTQRNSLNIVTVGTDGHLYLFFRPGGGRAKQLWNWADLTIHTGAAPFAGAVTAYETSGRVVTIAGTDPSGSVWVITWSSADKWRSFNATALAPGAQPLAVGSVAGFANKGGVGFIAGRTASGEVVLYRYQLKNGTHQFAYASVAAAVPGAAPLTGATRAAFSNGAITITGATTAAHAARWAFVPGQTWAFEDVSSLLS